MQLYNNEEGAEICREKSQYDLEASLLDAGTGKNDISFRLHSNIIFTSSV